MIEFPGLDNSNSGTVHINTYTAPNTIWKYYCDTPRNFTALNVHRPHISAARLFSVYLYPDPTASNMKM